MEGERRNFGPSVTGHAWRFLKNVFDDNVNNRKRCTKCQLDPKNSETNTHRAKYNIDVVINKGMCVNLVLH